MLERAWSSNDTAGESVSTYIKQVGIKLHVFLPGQGHKPVHARHPMHSDGMSRRIDSDLMDCCLIRVPRGPESAAIPDVVYRNTILGMPKGTLVSSIIASGTTLLYMRWSRGCGT